MCGFCVDELWELDEKAKEMANSFQGRILSKLVEREEEKVALENENNERRLEARRARLIQNEICNEEEAQQYIKDPFHALPSPINERHMEFVARERKKEREDEEKTEMEKARSIYKDSWLIQKEKEMYDLVEKKNNTVDIEMKSTLEGLILISENKIKMFHEKSGTPSRVGLHERKKMCLVLGILKEQDMEEIHNLYHRLPPQEATLTPPKTPSWTPRPEWGLSPSPVMRQESSMQESPMSCVPPKTPSWSPMSCDPPKTPSWSPKFNERQQEPLSDSEDSEAETFETPKSTTGNDSDDMFITPKPRRVVPETPTVFPGTQRKRTFLTPKPRRVVPATPTIFTGSQSKRKRSSKSQSSQELRGQNTIHTYFSKKH